MWEGIWIGGVVGREWEAGESFVLILLWGPVRARGLIRIVGLLLGGVEVVMLVWRALLDIARARRLSPCAAAGVPAGRRVGLVMRLLDSAGERGVVESLAILDDEGGVDLEFVLSRQARYRVLCAGRSWMVRIAVL